jgi:hypothetical protein
MSTDRRPTSSGKRNSDVAQEGDKHSLISYRQVSARCRASLSKWL